MNTTPTSFISDGFLDVSNKTDKINHKLYWQEYGNPEGVPIMLLHGGPGSGAMMSQLSLFDPEIFRIIMFDQRGAGKSTPHASLEENTTWHLVEDINKLREHLNITGKMHMFGGSWGSTLALVYTIKYPENISSLTLYGIFLGRKNDLADFYQSNANNLEDLSQAGNVQKARYNEWRRYVEFIPQSERGDMFEAYHQYLTCDDKNIQLKASGHWNRWERACLRYIPNETNIAKEPSDEYNLAHGRIENHYFRHGLFLSDDNSREQNYIINNVENIANIPFTIIQGEDDYVCPKSQAEDLFKAASEVSKENPPKLYMVKESGHSMLEDNVFKVLKQIAYDLLQNDS